MVFNVQNQRDVLFSISNDRYVLVEELPDNWRDAPDICSFRSLDRSFVFPGSCIFLETLVSFSCDLHQWFLI